MLENRSTGTLFNHDTMQPSQSGEHLNIFGKLTEGTGGDQYVFGTLIVEFSTTLDIVSAVTIEPGATYSPLGTVTVEPVRRSR